MQGGAEVWPHQVWPQREKQGQQLLVAAQVPHQHQEECSGGPSKLGGAFCSLHSASEQVGSPQCPR